MNQFLKFFHLYVAILFLPIACSLQAIGRGKGRANPRVTAIVYKEAALTVIKHVEPQQRVSAVAQHARVALDL